jgi:MFS transporter, PAT family, solute carrier family 33 (acetyl-CoA transportor), member 1
MSFTVFLALNSEAFRYASGPMIKRIDLMIRPSARWGTPILTLGGYLRFWSIVCFGVTSWLVLVQKEVGSAILFLAHTP